VVDQLGNGIESSSGGYSFLVKSAATEQLESADKPTQVRCKEG
jgi:hypothetical protein